MDSGEPHRVRGGSTTPLSRKIRQCVVTGAGSGIGRATARALADQGCQVLPVDGGYSVA